ncbi:ABC transporter substrate-binding protein [Alicyclobacillus macrosporangiidus]|uniref:ABC transporter substrate-binding protein n=1 Tax=Alicyclobacillus macrosporangiidus TaxID=392015 RepID=UPI00055471AD|nr:ABC transporter substrate-binding protein [Alicyclobacillus macrosporangiidus]
MRRFVHAAAISLCSAVLLAGCGTSGSGNGTAGSPPIGNKTLVVGRGGDSVTLDPANAVDTESLMVSDEIFDTLVRYKPGTSELAPDLATSWTPSSDGMSWTLKLQQNVTFQDGTPFNADAVVENIERWWDPSNPYHKGGTFADFKSDFGGFKGDKNCVLKDVKKIDDYTVELDLTHPFAPLMSILTQGSYAIVSPQSLKQYNGDIKEHPVGTGAFEFVSWTQNDKIVLKKNPHYRVSGEPKLDQLIFQVIKDNSARLNALRSGSIDFMEGVNPSDASAIKADPNLQLIMAPSNNVGYFAMNTQVKPFNDLRVRQAIAMTIDKKAIVDAYLNGSAVVATTILPPQNWGFDSELQDYTVDIAKAKQLLSEAGYPNGFKTTLYVMAVPRPYMPQPDKIGATLQADLKQIGIDVQIQTYDWATYIQKVLSGQHSMCLLGWSAGTWDPTNFMYTIYHSSNAKPPAYNVSFYKNPQVDQLLQQALNVSDQSQRAALYKRAQEIIHRDTPLIPLFHTTPLYAAAKYVTGYVPSGTGGAEFTTVDVAK